MNWIATACHAWSKTIINRIAPALVCLLMFSTHADSQTFPNDDTGRTLQAMAHKGVNLNRSYSVDFIHVFNDKHSAKAMQAVIKKQDADADVTLYEGDLTQGYEVYVTKTMYPTYDSIHKHEQKYSNIAKQFGGAPDGWGFESEYDANGFQ